MRIDIMTDIETLGLGSTSTIIQISAAAFDIVTGKVLEVIDIPLDICRQKIDADGSTIKWWLRTNPTLFARLILREGKSKVVALIEFNDWIEKHQRNGEVYLWGNGILFDNKMIQAQFESVGMKYPIHFRNDRDVRTILELASVKVGLCEGEFRNMFENSFMEKHNAVDDVLYQIALVHGCYKAIMGSGNETEV